MYYIWLKHLDQDKNSQKSWRTTARFSLNFINFLYNFEFNKKVMCFF